jgi:hypothetical protein
MVDAQSCNMSRIDQLKEQPVCRIENLRQLDTNGGQRIHIEKAAVVDLLAGDPPGTEPISLGLDQVVHPIEASGVRGIVKSTETFFNRLPNRGHFPAQSHQAIADDLPFAQPFGDSLW